MRFAEKSIDLLDPRSGNLVYPRIYDAQPQGTGKLQAQRSGHGIAPDQESTTNLQLSHDLAVVEREQGETIAERVRQRAA